LVHALPERTPIPHQASRRDELERDSSPIAALVVGLILVFILVVAGLDAGDTAPRPAAIEEWSGARGVEVRSCEETEHRLPARDPVQIYRCELAVSGHPVRTCIAVDRQEVVAAGEQLAVYEGCPPGNPFRR
jgi:hypothetical protein